ncbi:unnamed protein product [Aspergillus oryzae var. brunneus]|uniref:Unnamed protein product n=1 Tax=Aspergillus oryzae var. brunneus TaxID=332754 RepID=A0ABQ6KMI2_ASPOZ|nr:unnamed protein product [Aspergillus oryzae]GMG45151.1 unnamed protein product [Aspergillus oryzae var. brunneus]
MPLSRREALVRLARKYDALIVSDDVYDFLNWEPTDAADGESTRLPRIIDVDTYLDGGPPGLFGNCVSNGSFSKIVAPGCRVGWAEGTPEFIRDLSAAYVLSPLNFFPCMNLNKRLQGLVPLWWCTFAAHVDLHQRYV